MTGNVQIIFVYFLIYSFIFLYFFCIGFVLVQLPCMANSPQVLESPSGKFECPIPNYGQKFNYHNSQGLMYEAMEVRRCLKAGTVPSIQLLTYDT